MAERVTQYKMRKDKNNFTNEVMVAAMQLLVGDYMDIDMTRAKWASSGYATRLRNTNKSFISLSITPTKIRVWRIE